MYFNSLLLTAALHLLHNNLQGKLPNTIIQRLYSAQAWGEITFTLTYLLQLRLFWELPYQLRIHFVLGSVPFEESETSLCVRNVLFPREQRILGRTSPLQECSALVESLVCKHFSTFLVPISLHWAEHLVCKNVQPWLRVSIARTSQPTLYLVPYIFLFLKVLTKHLNTQSCFFQLLATINKVFTKDVNNVDTCPKGLRLSNPS